MTFRIGYRVGDGVAVETELQHLAIFGLTQKSGKTTALEAFAKRAGVRAIVFRTGRGELGFTEAHRSLPYFRERVDWRFIEGLVSAQLQEKARFYRGDIILACRGAKSVAEVHKNVLKRLEKAKNPWTQKVLVELNEYLTEIEESLRTHTFADHVDIGLGVNVFDLEAYPPAMQQLVIASTLLYVMERETGVAVVLPEARDFIPVDRLTPAKFAVEAVVRKGAKLGNYLWLDSQALTGLDMDVMRSVGLWLFGRQTLDLEVRRTLKFLPGRNHLANEVTGLGLGEFLAVEGEMVTKVYVQPAWLGGSAAVEVAQGKIQARDTHLAKELQEEDVDAKERNGYEDRIKKLEATLADAARAYTEAAKDATVWQQKWRQEHDRAEANAKAAAANAVGKIRAAPTPRELAAAWPAAASDESEETVPEHLDLLVQHDVPSLTVQEKVVTVETNQDTPRGKLALLIADGFFTGPRKQADVASELKARSWGNYNGGNSRVVLYKNLQELTAWGFFRYDGSNYELTPEARTRVHVIKEAVTA